MRGLGWSASLAVRALRSLRSAGPKNIENVRATDSVAPAARQPRIG